MSSLIQIRNVPQELHRRAKARAALAGLSLSELALQALERELARPTAAELAARIRQLKPVPSAPPSAPLIRQERQRRERTME